jgi:hypothetical protein
VCGSNRCIATGNTLSYLSQFLDCSTEAFTILKIKKENFNYSEKKLTCIAEVKERGGKAYLALDLMKEV